MEVLLIEQAECGLGRTGRRTVIVGEVEVRNAEVEGAAGDGTSVFQRVESAEVVPPAQLDPRQFDSACSCANVVHLVISVFRGQVGHQRFLV